MFLVSFPISQSIIKTYLKPFEAMRSGTAVVMADLRHWHCENGGLYPAGDAQALAAKIRIVGR